MTRAFPAAADSTVSPRFSRRRAWRAKAFASLTLATAAACGAPPAPARPPTDGVSTQTVAPGNGFGGGTIYFPANKIGRVGAIAAAPGFLTTQAAVAWYGPLLAREGFIVITINTNGVFDLPTSRATQLLAALDFLVNQSSVAAHVDPEKLAVLGWSMGGGGALEASVSRSSLKAAVVLAPWNRSPALSTNSVPTLFVACQDDSSAPPATHATAFYDALPATTPKAFLEIARGQHDCVTREDETIAGVVVPWMRRFLDDDLSASRTFCPGLPSGGPVSAYRANCPY